MNKEPNRDLFGNIIETNLLLRDKFIEPPFSIIDTKTGRWQTRKDRWKALGIESEIGRGDSMTYNIPTGNWEQENMQEEYYGEEAQKLNTSIFDPALCELMYRWFCPDGGKILDPFAGGSVRGIVANYLGYRYTGIELSQKQIDSNKEQALDILDINNQPQWYAGDSDEILDNPQVDYYGGKFHWKTSFDFIFSCPPYLDLEVYSDNPNDLSTMNDKDFEVKYQSIISKSCKLLKSGGYACFVVGDVRDKKTGYYRDFISMTIRVFKNAGIGLYNEAILLNSLGSAMLRAGGNMKSQKLVKVHQNILIFKKL